MRILVVEDEKPLSALIQRGLIEAGYVVDVAYDGEEGENYAEMFPYDLIILDIILPKKEGLEVCRSLRNKNISSRILILTSRDSISDRVKGLDSGADDYLVKPFSFDELLARIRALLRRDSSQTSILQLGDLSINTSAREVKRGQRIIELTSKEYSLLEYLMFNSNMVITRRMIEDHVWNMPLNSESNLIEVYINRIRSKIDEGKDSLILTIRGTGYRLKVP